MSELMSVRVQRIVSTAVLNGAALPYSNGCLEGFNRKIKQIERTAFGYFSFTNLLTRIRLEENLYEEKKKICTKKICTKKKSQTAF